jgi:hypothetical protein
MMTVNSTIYTDTQPGFNLEETSMHPFIQEILDPLLQGLTELTALQIDGIYLTGSISLQDFQFPKSDIDMVVLLRNFPDAATISMISRVHSKIQRDQSKPELSVIYINYKVLSSPNPAAETALQFHQGKTSTGLFEMAPVTLFELKTTAITLLGKASIELSITISTIELDQFLNENIHSYWKKWMVDHSRLDCKKILLYLFPRLTEWSVLGMGRQWCTLITGQIVSKTQAGQFLLDQLPAVYHPIITEALTIRSDLRTYPLIRSYAIRPSFSRYRQTTACLQAIVIGFDLAYQKKYHLK